VEGVTQPRRGRGAGSGRPARAISHSRDTATGTLPRRSDQGAMMTLSCFMALGVHSRTN